MSPIRTFIVEDSPVIIENLIATLEELTSVVVVGTSPDEDSSVQWLSTHMGEFDLVIIDVFLKTGSGLGVLRAVSRLSAVPALAVLTNYATADIRRQCLKLGASMVFDKSTELDELVAFCSRIGQPEDRKAVRRAD
jgi:DNA-binding NarL/FixJ family response regulator